MQRYSQFISFPIYLWASKEVEDEVDDEEAIATKDDLTSEEGTPEEESEDTELVETDGTKDDSNPDEGEE